MGYSIYRKEVRPTIKEFSEFMEKKNLTSQKISDEFYYKRRTVESWRSWRQIPYPAWRQIAEKYL